MNDWTNSVREFLDKRMKEEGIEKVPHLSDLTGVPITTIRAMKKGRHPEIKNIIKFANYFSCSVDEILGRSPQYYQNNKIHNPRSNLEEMSSNLRSFIKDQLEIRKITQYELGRAIGRSEDAVRHFLREGINVKNANNLNAAVKMPNTDTILDLANYFKIPIDDMLGRSVGLEVNRQISDKEKMSSEVLKEAQRIGKTVNNLLQESPTNNSTPNIPKSLNNIPRSR